MFSVPLGIYSEVWPCGSSYFLIFCFPYCFPYCLLQFTLPRTVYNGSLFSISLPILVIYCLLDDRPDRCEVIFYCCFDLHFLDDQCCWTFSHVSISHRDILSGKMTIQFFCQFLKSDYLFICHWVILFKGTNLQLVDK